MAAQAKPPTRGVWHASCSLQAYEGFLQRPPLAGSSDDRASASFDIAGMNVQADLQEPARP